jgi:hypothetical protein
MENPAGKPIDILQARVIQARAAVSILLHPYSEQSPRGEHPLSAQSVNDALWAITELLDQACDASDALTAAEVG